MASPQIGALSNDVLQSQEPSGTSLTTTPSAVNLTTTGPMTQAVQGADVAHQTYSSPIPAIHPFNIPPPNLVSYPGQGLPAPLPPGPGQGHIPYVSTISGNIGVPAIAQGPPRQDVSYPCSSSDTKGDIGTTYLQFLTPVVTSTQPSMHRMNVGGVERRKRVSRNRHHLQKSRWSVNLHIVVAIHNVTEVEVRSLQRCLCLQERVTFPGSPLYTS